VAMAAFTALAAAPKAKPAEGEAAKAKTVKAKAAPAKVAKVPLPNLDKAMWIWDAKGAVRAGRATCYFRKTFDLADKPTSATVLITADNCYDLYVNGSLVGSDAGAGVEVWSSVEKYDVAHLLVKGSNVLAVRGRCLGGAAGLVAAARIDVAGQKPLEIVTDKTWRYATGTQTGWAHSVFDGEAWPAAAELTRMGTGLWGRLAFGKVVARGGGGRRTPPKFSDADDDFKWPTSVIFISGRVADVSTRLPQSIWRIGGSRAYLASDIPAPSVSGKRLYVLDSCGATGGKPRLLYDAGAGVLGSPSMSYDGKTVLFSLAPAGESFYQIYRLALDRPGAKLQAMTKGPFHHYDPAELPDGRIVFSTTRMGSRDEYHGNTASVLFAMKADGTDMQPITQHIVSDREPVVTADGLIAFVRCDNFMERAKVETQIHVVHPDGTSGQVWFGPDRQAAGYDRANASEGDLAWLRRFGYGSPAPLPDGRVVVLSAQGMLISTAALSVPERASASVNLFDISPLPDGRLLCTTSGFGGIGVLDLESGKAVRIDTGDVVEAHSVIYAGARKRPPVVPPLIDESAVASGAIKTGFLYCQSVNNTKQTNGDWSRVRGVRVYEGAPFSNRAGLHSYTHIGVEAVELGTAPLAPDGSFYVEVPADRALAIQAVDAEGRAVVNEITWIYVRPGEQRSCVGCHASRQSTPTPRVGPVLATRRAPIKLLGAGRPHRYRGNNAANGGVLNLQFDRFREMAAINLFEQGVASRQADVKALCAALRDAKVGVIDKVSAAQRLAVLRDREAVDALIALLDHADSAVRMEAAMALAACGNRSAAAPLLKALDDDDPAVAQAASAGLEHLTGHSETFNSYLGSDKRDKGAAAWRAWIKANPWPAVEQSLVARLAADTDPAVRYRAIITLGHSGTKAVGAAALRAFLSADSQDDLRASMEAMRAIGHLKDDDAIDILVALIAADVKSPRGKGRGSHEMGATQAPSHRIAAAAEALGRIGTPKAQAALIEAFGKLENFWRYTFNTADHDWLMGCHSSPPHYRIIEALDRVGATRTQTIVPAILKSVPIDPDRALLYENDAYEILTERVVGRSGLTPAIVETALAVLGDSAAKPAADLKAAVTASPPARTFKPYAPEARAAHIISVVCTDATFAPRIAKALDRFRAVTPSRNRNWTCFYLARALGKLADPAGAPSLIACLETDPTEASFGRYNPPHIFLHKAQTPCYRAAAAYALGLVGHRRAHDVLMSTVANFENAMDTRSAAARALARTVTPATAPKLQKLAATYPELVTRRSLQAACDAVK